MLQRLCFSTCASLFANFVSLCHRLGYCFKLAQLRGLQACLLFTLMFSPKVSGKSWLDQIYLDGVELGPKYWGGVNWAQNFSVQSSPSYRIYLSFASFLTTSLKLCKCIWENCSFYVIFFFIHLKRHPCRCTLLLAEFNLRIILDSGSSTFAVLLKVNFFQSFDEARFTVWPNSKSEEHFCEKIWSN